MILIEKLNKGHVQLRKMFMVVVVKEKAAKDVPVNGPCDTSHNVTSLSYRDGGGKWPA